MGYTVIAPVGDNLKALFVGMKDFPTSEVILITPPDRIADAQDIAKKLDEFTINTRIIRIESDLMSEMFRVFAELVDIYDIDDIVVNVATGDRMSTCAAMSACYANGIRAFGVIGKDTMLMPIMKLSYYNELSDNKMRILQALQLQNPISIRDLSNKLGMSISLLSYHINGNNRYKGLKEFRLVEVQENSNEHLILLSKMGSLLLNGYIKRRGQS